MMTLDRALVMFFRRVEIITSMEMGGKLDSETAYQMIKNEMKKLKKSRKKINKAS
tara:strand:+ start:1357 stop:1521 length:165 start_codon:yes stop_codon:yes gene_type:complete